MNTIKLYFFINLVLSLVHYSLTDESICGDWAAFKDEKCFQVFDESLLNFDNALNLCAQNDQMATLAIIQSKEEQHFITNYIFNEKQITDNVWVGIKNSTNNFTGINNNVLTYTNWAQGSPQKDIGYDCVQIMSDNALMGKWINEPCSKRNAVVCQKLQSWTLLSLQKNLLDDRKHMRDTVDSLQLEVNSLKEENKNHETFISNLKQNPVPKGFIYVQLPTQEEPKVIWPTVNWTDVSFAYAGLFFRVIGGNSAGFGTVQASDTTRLSSIRWQTNTDIDLNNVKLNSHETGINAGQWSEYISVGNWVNSHGPDVLQLYVSSGEIRPKNQAIKIWKRS